MYKKISCHAKNDIAYGKVKYENDSLYAIPLLGAARLEAMAIALIEMPEGCMVL